MSPEISYLLSPRAIQDSSQKIFADCLSGGTNFELHSELLPELAEYVAEVTRNNYPSLEIPYHSRWSHFDAFGKERVEKFFEAIKDRSREERALIELDLVIVSVLLDAGAGAEWTYSDPDSEQSIGRSEGLGMASFDAFVQGVFSSSSEDKFRVDASRLQDLTLEDFEKIFQIKKTNQLFGLEGRLGLLKSLGKRMEESSEFFPKKRPGSLMNYWSKKNSDQQLRAEDLLQILLLSLGPIWPSRLKKENTPLGDVWEYKGELVAFHKLSQWLSYSLLDTFDRAGWTVLKIDGLTGLAEYRNGGLFIDSGVLTLRDPEMALRKHSVDSELVVEWRALTLALLEELAPYIRKELDLPDLALPKILEGGTWWAGRKIAAEKREDRSPPIQIISDGTVF